MSKKLLVVVDMQNDFVTGALANKDAEKIVSDINDKVKFFDGDVAFTRDTHFLNYMETQEGNKLPVPHCIWNTEGWQIVSGIEVPANAKIFDKPTFGSINLATYIKDNQYDEVVFCGVCTGICVISNVALVKAFCPETKVIVLENLCACVTPESHKTAIEAMKTFQVDIV